MEDNIDFVKTNSSPGSSWAHLRRNSMSTNSQPSQSTPIVPTRKLDTSMGSAKKVMLLRGRNAYKYEVMFVVIDLC